MKNYKLIIEYYKKGNNNSQIATLCSCSRMTVWRVFQRVKALGIEVYVLNDMSKEEISSLLFPERAKAGEGYLIPDFKWEEFQMCKHQSSIRLCWRRYCKRAAKQNLMAYSWICKQNCSMKLEDISENKKLPRKTDKYWGLMYPEKLINTEN